MWYRSRCPAREKGKVRDSYPGSLSFGVIEAGAYEPSILLVSMVVEPIVASTPARNLGHGQRLIARTNRYYADLLDT